MFTPRVFEDERGYFFESYQERFFREHGIVRNFVQDNQSKSQRGTLRGLHYQIQNVQAKLLRVLRGEIFDVAVDLRKSSPTFGKYVSARLSAENRMQIFIPEGFAHGFYVLSDNAEILYKASDFYNPAAERSILWNDPDLAVEWPLMNDEPLILSEKDKIARPFKKADLFD